MKELKKFITIRVFATMYDAVDMYDMSLEELGALKVLTDLAIQEQMNKILSDNDQ